MFQLEVLIDLIYLIILFTLTCPSIDIDISADRFDLEANCIDGILLLASAGPRFRDLVSSTYYVSPTFKLVQFQILLSHGF